MTSVVGFDTPCDANGTLSADLVTVTLIRAELIRMWNLAKSDGLRPNGIEYPGCMSEAQLDELKSVLPSDLLAEVKWICNMNESSSIKPAGLLATYIAFDY